VVTATASSRPICMGRSTRACARVRGELGVAGALARAMPPAIAADDALAPYTQLGVEVTAEHSFGPFDGVVSVDAGWAKGLVIVAQDRVPVRLDGPAITAVAGARW